MLIDAGQLMGYVLHAEDGELGRCKDFIVDDRDWTVRYVVADTGRWLPGRKVLLPPGKVQDPEFSGRRLPVKLTKKQIIASPPLEEHAALFRQYENRWCDYYTVSPYWQEEDKICVAGIPTTMPGAKVSSERKSKEEVHVFSVSDLTGATIVASDGDIGHLADVLMDLKAWKVRYAIVDTRNWLPGKQVCVSITCVEWVDPSKKRVGIGLSKEKIKNSPEYNPLVPVTEEYQVVLHDYYGWPKYWETH
jgi:sporulation protein YlmC with PRC-barrel domain